MNPNLFALQHSNQHPFWQSKSNEPNYSLNQRAGDDQLFASFMNPKNLSMLDKSQVKPNEHERLASKPFVKNQIRPDREPRSHFDSPMPMISKGIQDEVQERKVKDEPYRHSKSDEKKQATVSLDTKHPEHVPNEKEMRKNAEDLPDRKTPFEKNENEVLLFLSGQLQFINPTSIPGLVADNRFIQEALSSSDLEKFMQTERPLSEWAVELNLQPSEMASLDLWVLNADETINAFELLDQLGLDGQQVKSELLLLKDNLPLDGLAPYMIRAVALQGQRQEVQPNINQVSDSKNAPIKPEPKIEPLLFNNYQLNPEADHQSATQPTATLVTADPFQTIQSEWNSQTVYRVFDADALIQDPSNQIQQDGIRLTSEFQLPDEINLAFVSMEPEIIPPDNGQELIANPEMILQDPSDLQQAKPMDLTSLMFTEVPISDDFVAGSTGDSQQGTSQQDLQNGSRQDFLTPLQVSKGDPKILGQSETNFAENLKKPVSIERFTIDTLNRAQMLVKEGGGSIRIDLGHDELGKVELAIDVKDQNLEIRVVTNSEKAREMLAQELPRLRDALEHADLNLKSVEIGLKSESQWSQQHQNDRYSQGQEKTFSYENQVEAGPKVFQRHQILRQQNWNQPISHNGQILIRV